MRALLTYSVLTLLLALAIGPVTPAQAQDWTGRGRVQGTVLDPDGDPVEGARITLSAGRTEGNGPEPILTNKKGKWSYLGLKGGNWLVRIEKQGYLVSEGQFPLNEFSANKPVIVNLKDIPQEVIQEATGQKVLEGLERGNTLLAEGKTAEARAEYELALVDLEPENQPGVLMGIARSYYQEENLADTEATLQRALEVDPSHVDALKLLSSLLVAAGREKEAKVYMDRLPEGEVLFADAYLNLGIDYYNNGELDEALAEFDRVVARFPENADAYYYRGLVLVNKKENDRAAADFQKAIELSPDGPRAAESGEFLKYLTGGG